MSLELFLLTPLLVLLIGLAFGFTGCGGEDFTSGDDDRGEPPEGPKYSEIVKGTPGFVAHWPMNETSGATEAEVDGLPNLDAVYVGNVVPGNPSAFVQKDPGNFAPSLDGATAYLEVPFSPLLNLDNNLPFSVEVWVKPAAPLPDGVEQIVISSHAISMAGNNRGYQIALLGTNGPQPTVRGSLFWTNLPAATNVDVTPTDGDPGAWLHIALTFAGAGPGNNVLTLYVNVAGVGAMTPAEQTGANYDEVQGGGAGERPLRFGAGQLPDGGAEKFFEGLIDEVVFYQAALDPIEVEEHFQAL